MRTFTLSPQERAKLRSMQTVLQTVAAGCGYVAMEDFLAGTPFNDLSLASRVSAAWMELAETPRAANSLMVDSTLGKDQRKFIATIQQSLASYANEQLPC